MISTVCFKGVSTAPGQTTVTPIPSQGSTFQTPPSSGSGTQQPSLPGSTNTPPYRSEKPIGPVPEKDEDIKGSSHRPQLNGPSLDRMTANPVRTATYQAVSYDNASPSFDYGGWRASDK